MLTQYRVEMERNFIARTQILTPVYVPSMGLSYPLKKISGCTQIEIMYLTAATLPSVKPGGGARLWRGGYIFTGMIPLSTGMQLKDSH